MGFITFFYYLYFLLCHSSVNIVAFSFSSNIISNNIMKNRHLIIIEVKLLDKKVFIIISPYFLIKTHNGMNLLDLILICLDFYSPQLILIFLLLKYKTIFLLYSISTILLLLPLEYSITKKVV